MFLSNNTIITTEKGTVLANTEFNKLFSLNGFKEIEKESKNQTSIFIKTSLFPTTTIGGETEILAGRLESAEKTIFLRNSFYDKDSLKEGDYFYIPKINYKIKDSLNRTIVWLYAKYLASGYYCLEKQTNKPTIIINLKRFSKKEASRLKRYSDISYDLNKKIIIIQNEYIIEELGISKKSINYKLYGCEPGLCEFFLHSMLIELNNKLMFQYKTLAYDIFMFAYSKCGKIYKISENKSENNKNYILSLAETTSYMIFKNELYVKVDKILEGKNVKGIDIKNPEKNVFCITFLIIR